MDGGGKTLITLYFFRLDMCYTNFMFTFTMESLNILLAVGHDVSKKRTWDPDLGQNL